MAIGPGQTSCNAVCDNADDNENGWQIPSWDVSTNSVNNLCMPDTNEYVFAVEITTTADNTSFYISITASGNFVINWGDMANHEIKTIARSGTNGTTYSHKYADAGTYTVKIGGLATGYNTNTYTAAISFFTGSNSQNNAKLVTGLSGSLGAIFPTLSSSTTTRKTPLFYDTFNSATNLQELPANLFGGVSGNERYMFAETFYGCTGLTEIPADLFSGVTGAAMGMFHLTFYGCTGLTEIPADLFSGVLGAANYMFNGTFSGCTGLTEIPADLFSGVTGAAMGMFGSTFNSCTGLTSIPSNLFSGVTGAASEMFHLTFYGCTSLSAVRVGDNETVNYIPAGMFPDNTANLAYMYTSTFSGTALTSSCPAGVESQPIVNGWGDSPAVCAVFYCPDGYDANDGAMTTAECQIACPAGTYLAAANDTECSPVGAEYWAAASVVNYGNVGVRNACPIGLKTTGVAGPGADQATDCGKILQLGTHTLRLRNEQRTHPSLAVQVGEYVLYGDSTPENRGHLRIMWNGQLYSIYNADLD